MLDVNNTFTWNNQSSFHSNIFFTNIIIIIKECWRVIFIFPASNLQPLTSNQLITELISLSYDNVWSGGEQHNCGYHSKKCKKNQTKTVQNHCSEFPITNNVCSGFLIFNFVRDDPQLLQDQWKLSDCPGGKGGALLLQECRADGAQICWGPEIWQRCKIITSSHLQSPPDWRVRRKSYWRSLNIFFKYK